MNKNEVILDSGDYGESFSSGKEPDLSLFKSNELETLGYVKTYFKDFTANKIKEFSHKEEGYKATEQGDFISFGYADKLKV